MSAYRDPFSLSRLWAVRWLTGTLFAVQVACGIVGLFVAPHWVPFQRFWLGGALATFPGFLLGLLLQFRINPSAIAEQRLTVWLLGVMTPFLTGYAIVMEIGGPHAG
jgi:hypothetical protein